MKPNLPDFVNELEWNGVPIDRDAARALLKSAMESDPGHGGWAVSGDTAVLVTSHGDEAYICRVVKKTGVHG